jgi:translation initiation factor 4E
LLTLRTLYYDSKTYKPETPAVNGDDQAHSWEASLLTVGTIDTVEGFARHMNNVRLPSSLAKGANYHLFKDDIRPVREDRLARRALY